MNRDSLPRQWAILVALAATVASFAPGLTAQNPPNPPPPKPTLRLETGMHTAAIREIGVDRSGTFLVTASEDKTARVWELPSGRLLRVLRVSIGDRSEGRIDAAAISPDGKTIALGGWTSPDGLHESIYLFDRESGRLLRRLTGLPTITTLLAFSPDGTRLAALLFANNGLRVFRTSDWSEIGRDTAYDTDAYGADFDAAGRLVTTSYDGWVRLYDPALRLVAKVQPAGGKRPVGVSFSPDGRKLAVGFGDSPAIQVLSGETLAPVFSPETRGAGLRCGMLSVAWSRDGTMLYAGGTCSERDERFLRRWSNAGEGPSVDTFVSHRTIFDLTPLPSGAIVYAAADPTWGILDASLKPIHQEASPIADYSEMRNAFRTDMTGAVVRFGYKLDGDDPAIFNLAERTLTLGPPLDTKLRPRRTAGLRIAVTNWEGEYAPQFNATPIPLQPNERSITLSIAPDDSGFVLGTSFLVRMFNRTGQELWNIPAHGVAGSVNITGDGRWAQAAFSDGTIHWYRLTDGQEALAFFPHADRKRWVLWTPSGYYDASPGAEDLIGWHVNNGPDRPADFFPVSQFRATYYRPDVVARVLEEGDEANAVRLANLEARRQAAPPIVQQLPPIVDIVSPADKSEVTTPTVTVRFTVRTPSGEPITNVRAMVDGRPAQGALQLSQGRPSDNVREVRITVPQRDSEVAVIAENRYAPSVPATVRLTWRGNVPRGLGPAPAAAAVVQPKLYILAVGVSQYGNPQFNLGYPAKDARDFVATMMMQKGLLYRDVVVYKTSALTDAAATKDEILGGFDWIRKETTSNDVAMVFLAGHGVNDQSNNYFFYPYNVDTDSLLRTGVSFTEIRSAVSSIAGKALFFVDTCHSGNSIGLGGRRGAVDINLVINELSSAQNGAIVFSAATGNESSYERDEWRNGAFTKALVDGLNGAAAVGDTGRITYSMLNVYISEQVKTLTKGQQHPTMISPETVPDFPVAVKR